MKGGREIVTGIWEVEIREVAKHPSVYRQPPAAKNDQVPNASSAELRTPVLKEEAPGPSSLTVQ